MGGSKAGRKGGREERKCGICEKKPRRATFSREVVQAGYLPCSRCGRGTAAHTPIDAHGRAADGPRRRLKASPAAPRPPRVASPTHADPLVGSLLVSRQRGLCVSPLRGRWHKGDYLHGAGGERLRGGRAATELDCVGFGCIVETLFDDN